MDMSTEACQATVEDDNTGRPACKAHLVIKSNNLLWSNHKLRSLYFCQFHTLATHRHSAVTLFANVWAASTGLQIR